ncbi:MAG: hypothetical protein K1V80_05175 [Muribaculaceae bacterium]
MKRTLLAIAGILMALSMPAATLRVNNLNGSGAQYTTFEEAHSAAQDGDVIIVDGTPKSYGQINISKKITVQGPGYFLGVNDATKEGYSPATFDEINLKSAGAKITGLCVEGNINMQADDLVITRCYVRNIRLSRDFSFTEDHITRGIIHQNYIMYGIYGDSYSASATYMQVTNNIIPYGGNVMFCNMDNSVISRNTGISTEAGVRNLTNCVIENNISYNIESSYYSNKDNTYSNNYMLGDSKIINNIYGSNRDDATVKAGDAKIATDKGAFSGDDPYVLSGIPRGVRVTDLDMPQSVEQGSDLQITVKVATRR